MKLNFWEKYAIACLVVACMFGLLFVQMHRFQIISRLKLDRLTGKIVTPRGEELYIKKDAPKKAVDIEIVPPLPPGYEIEKQ